jgi:hypothetical protein
MEIRGPVIQVVGDCGESMISSHFSASVSQCSLSASDNAKSYVMLSEALLRIAF